MYTFTYCIVITQSLSCVWLFSTPRIVARQASLSFSISQSLLKLMSIESVTSSNHLVLYRPLLFLPSIFPSIRDFSYESAVCGRWPKYWNLGFHVETTWSLCVSRSIVSNSLWPHVLKAARLLCPWNSLDENTGVGCHFLLQGIFLIQRSNPGLLRCRWVLYNLSHQGSPWFNHINYFCLQLS